MSMRTSVAAIAVLALAGPAGAATLDYTVDLKPLNDSGVSGQGAFTVNTTENTLTAHVVASGLEPGTMHPQHIHGPSGPDGALVDAMSPTLADDADGDGFVELAEGRTQYGPILVELEDAAGDYPTAPDGSFDFSRTFDLDDEETFAGDFDVNDLLGSGEESGLGLREVVVHGLTVSGDAGAGTDGEVDGTAGYKPVLPVASGEITAANVPAPIPLPAAGWLMVAGLGGLGAMRARRKAGRA